MSRVNLDTRVALRARVQLPLFDFHLCVLLGYQTQCLHLWADTYLDTMPSLSWAVGTYKGEPGGAKFCNIKATLTLTLTLILNPRSPYLCNLDPPSMCHDPYFDLSQLYIGACHLMIMGGNAINCLQPFPVNQHMQVHRRWLVSTPCSRFVPSLLFLWHLYSVV